MLLDQEQHNKSPSWYAVNTVKCTEQQDVHTSHSYSIKCLDVKSYPMWTCDLKFSVGVNGVRLNQAIHSSENNEKQIKKN